MKTLTRSLLVFSVVLALPAAGFAQRFSRPAAAPRSAGMLHSFPVVRSSPVRAPMRVSVPPRAPSRRAVLPPGSSSPILTSTNGGFNNQFFSGSGLGLPSTLSNVPGLGFDYSHLAAVSGDLGVEDLIDPITQANVSLALKFLRSSPPVGFGGGSYYLPTPEEYYGEEEAAPQAEPTAPPQQQPQVIVVQAPPASTQSAANVASQPAAQPQAAPLPDVGDFLLITKEGEEVKAGAFYHQGNQIVYITPAGARRTMPLSDLDVGSTVLVNQERGTDLQNLL